MARLKRSSTVLEVARQRLSGLKSITPKPDFGPALSIEQYEQETEEFNTNLDKYNDLLSLVDRLSNELDAAEVQLRDKNRRMLAAVEAHYGPDSSEYESAGGTRTSDRKQPARKKTGGS
jgi:hypothetical protein